MPPDSHLDEDEDYASSEDSDFAPDAAADQASDHSESEDDDENKATGEKRNRSAAEPQAEDAGYDNSGDEAIIEKGNKRRKKSKTTSADAEDEEGGEGGLIKTRRQRAAEKEERRCAANAGPVTIDVDAVWAQMLAGNLTTAANPGQDEIADGKDEESSEPSDKKDASKPTTSNDDSSSEMIRIERTYNFAGRVHTEEKLVHRESAEAKLYLASQGETVSPDDPPAKRVTKKAFRSAFEPLTDPLPQRADLNLGMAARVKEGKEAQAKKLNTVEKSRMDWAGYVDKEGIKDELELAGKSKESYTARQDFLARSEAKRDEDARRVRLAGRA